MKLKIDVNVNVNTTATQNMSNTMNALEQQLQYPFGEMLPDQGQALEVAPGVKWIRMALPFALNHISLWLVRDVQAGREGWTAVDCCISSETSRAQWEEIFNNALEGLPILRVLVTHMHPDHIGLADWLCQRWNAPLWISATDYHVANTLLRTDVGARGAAAADFYASHGLQDQVVLDGIRQRGDHYQNLVPSLPRHFHRLMDGMPIQIGAQTWRCIVGYGHAPEHMALYCEQTGVLISGDMVLPRISTNVSVFEMEPTSNSLALFLASLERYRPLPADTLVLPSHGKPFKGLHTRLDQLQSHHKERLKEVSAACKLTACSSADIVPVMFPRILDAHQLPFALGEALSHLHYLWIGGELERELCADGVYRFRVRKKA